MHADQLINQLQLQLHPVEGGYFRRTYQSDRIYLDPGQPEKQRHCASSIFYLLCDAQPIGYMHQNESDILHCYQLGGAMEYVLLDGNGELETVLLGPDLDNGQVLQLLVPGGVWKASRLITQGFSLISELVVPGFNYADNTLAERDWMRNNFPRAYSAIEPLLKP